jgi:RNA polymerase sigma factor for flagellar operon FliA
MLEKAQMMNALEGAIEALPERERMVLQLYYVEGLILKEIVEVLGVTESRVSQILSGTVKKLRQQLQIT